MENRTRVVLLMFLLINVAMAAVEGQRPTHNNTLIILRLPELDVGGTESVFWAAVKNRRDRARLVCVAEWSYDVVDETGNARGAGELGTHDCTSAMSFHIVEAGQTLYWPTTIKADMLAGARRIGFTAIVIDKSVTLKDRREYTLSWEGRPIDAVEAGRSLIR